MNCADCKNEGLQICTVCCSYQGGVPDRWEPKPLTNADRIRAMSDEELADYFSELSCWPNASKEVCKGMANCEKCWLDWLRQEVKE